MPTANTDPIYSKSGITSTNAATSMSQPITAAANDFTGVSANNVLVFTAAGTVGDNIGGSFIQRLRFKAAGTNAGATVARIFINNGSVNTTATNNTFFDEVALPITTANTAGITSPAIDVPMNIALEPGFRIYVGLGAAVGGGWTVTPFAGRY